MRSNNHGEIVQLTADIVSAFVANNEIDQLELSGLIRDVLKALVKAPATAAEPEKPILVPAVPRKKSVTPDYIISLEDGRKFKMLKRHLGIQGLTPDEYRAKWDLPSDYPMVAPSYAKKRSALAKGAGFGRKKGAAAPAKKATKSHKRAAVR